MSGPKRIASLISPCFALFFVWSTLSFGGVPSPIPFAEEHPDAPKIQIAHVGDFEFENGEIVKNFKVSYVTHGKLNEKKDNVILAMHSAWGDHRQYDFLTGPGKALDTNKYFVIATDRLGNPAQVKNITTGPTNSGLRMAFPDYTMRDEVNLDYKLLKEYLGFDQILAVLGGSVGGMKAFQFGVSYPGYAKGLIPIAGTPATNPLTKTMVLNLMRILEMDSGWHGGRYEINPLWAVHTMQWNWILWIYTPQWFVENLKTDNAYQNWTKMVNNILQSSPQDARDMYYTHQAWCNYDIGDTPGFNGDTKAALQSIQEPVLIITGKGDMLFDCEENLYANKAISQSTYVEIDNTWGHMNCGGWEPEGVKIIDREIRQFLSRIEATGD